MTRTFIATLLATVLAVSTIGSAAQAHGKNDNLVKFLGAATALVIIGSALNDRKSHKSHTYVHTPTYKKPIIPGKCKRTAVSHSGKTYRVYGRKCLHNNYHGAHRLPGACEIRYYNTKGKLRYGYGANCLRNHGFATH